MAAWMTHFRIADAFIDIIGENKLDLPSFVFGNVAPDSGYINGDGFTYTPPKEISHFGHSKNRDYGRFISSYLSGNRDIESFSFYLGYYLHLLTDEQWALKILYPAKEKYAEEFARNKFFVMKLKEDWGGLDALYLKRNPSLRAFAIFSGIESFPNKYFDFFPPDAFDRQLKRLRDYYAQLSDDPERVFEREYKYLTERQLDAFIADTVVILKGQFYKTAMTETEILNK